MIARIAGWMFGWVLAGALYLLLIDITSLPELLVGVAAAILGATGYELAREQAIVGEAIRGRWLIRIYRPFAKVPGDVARVSLAAVRALWDRSAAQGQFRSVPFQAGKEQPTDAGRRALTEAFGSFAPNTFIVGIDEERELVLAHQLVRSGGREAIDLMELG